MQAGKLRHQIVIERLNTSRGTTRDAHGGVVEDWVSVFHGPIWANIEPLRAVEILRANQVDARITHRIETRYHPGIDASMRAVFQGRVFLLLSVIDPGERHISLDMLAMESPNV